MLVEDVGEGECGIFVVLESDVGGVGLVYHAWS
jgi:hypothetical protein